MMLIIGVALSAGIAAAVIAKSQPKPKPVPVRANRPRV